MKKIRNESKIKNKILTSAGKLGILACTLALALVFSLTACGWGDDSDDNNSVIVCLGDSLTAGMSATTAWIDDKSKSYPAYLQTKVTATVVNAGVSGNTTADALARLDSDVISKNPDIVVICLGGNDFFSAEAEAELEGVMTSLETNMQNIIEALDTRDRLIFIAKYYNDAVARDHLANIGVTDYATQTTYIERSDAIFDRLAALETTNAELVLIEDIWTGVFDGTDTMSTAVGDIHPNAAGYEVMADNYFNAMESYLQNLGLVR